MPQTCPKCHRANPADALFCYEDGFSLGGRTGHAGPVDPGQQPFPHPFVFPNGAVCRNFDQLALACHNEWPTAIELLRNGDLANFLAGLGRADLAKAAREAAREEDKDRALDQLLGQLPANTIEPAKLHVETLHVNLGQLTVGKDHRWELRLANQGMRMLSGTIACTTAPGWRSAKAAARRARCFSSSDTAIPVQVRGKLLRAAAKPIEGRLVIETNGGAATVIVTAEVPVKPFPEGVLAGAITPRKIAEKAKAAPKEAAPLFENGAVARWYIQNGWTYPVQGPSASGLGAVQQFFEALGLTTPPKVEVRESSLVFEGKPGDRPSHTLDVAAVEKRPIFASAVSDHSWLKVSKVVLDGRTAHVKLAVDPVPDRPGETLPANLTVRANGNQRFVVPVSLRISASRTRPPVASDGVFPASGWWKCCPTRRHTRPPSATGRPWQPPDGVRGRMAAHGRRPCMEALPVVDDDDAAPRKPTALNMILPLLPVAFILFGLFVTAGARRRRLGASAPRPGRTSGPGRRPRAAADRHPVPRPGQGGTLGTGGMKPGGEGDRARRSGSRPCASA